MTILSSTGVSGFLSSAKATGKQILNKAGKLIPEYIEDFVSGFAGHGWKIWERVSGIWRIETDELVVRRTMIVFEMLISKIRCIKGALNISQGNGKIKTAELKEDGNWYITIEDEMSFVPQDYFRCQHFSNMAKFYWVEITDIINDNTTLIIPATEFMGSLEYKDGIEYVGGSGEMNIPKPGDEIIQFGNRVNKDRQSAIYLHADEGGQPAIDILFNINSKSFEGCLNMRMGGSIPGEGDMKGFYCENGMIKGTVNKHVVYQIKPDGSAMFGDGSAQFNADKSGYIAGGTISWEWDESKGKYVCTMQDVVLTWDNLSDEAKENLKGDKGEDAVFYLIEFNEDGNTVQSISAIADGVPKGKSLKASLYKITSGKKELCGARRFTISAGSQIWEVIPPMGGGPLHTISIDYGDSSIQSYTVAAYDDVNTVIALATIHKVLDGQQGEQGNPGADANLLPWIEKWNGYATELGGDYIVTPKMFSGKVETDENGTRLLTGIAQGKDCITASDGTTRTGIFALVDNEPVFELDPINKKYKFKGKVTADSGEIGGFSITNSSVGSNKNGDKMVLTRNGLTFKGGSKNVGIGDTLPDSTGASNMVAGVFETKIDTGDIQQTGLSTLYAKTSGGMRGVAISAVTDDRDKDIAISFKGGINTNGIARKGENYGDLGLTGVYTIEKAWHAAANRWAKTSFHFVDGILVRVYFDTPY